MRDLTLEERIERRGEQDVGPYNRVDNKPKAWLKSFGLWKSKRAGVARRSRAMAA